MRFQSPNVSTPADRLAQLIYAQVCYRTSQQITRTAGRLLPVVLRDTDDSKTSGRESSVFDGPAPEVHTLAGTEAEAGFFRTARLMPRTRAAITGIAGTEDTVTAPMSLAKGLEFRAVVVMACDQGILPLDERVADAADEAELDDIYETERRLLYVACTRAREHLLLTGTTPASEYLADFTP